MRKSPEVGVFMSSHTVLPEVLIFGICENMCSHDILAGGTTVCELEGFKWQKDNSGHNF